MGKLRKWAAVFFAAMALVVFCTAAEAGTLRNGRLPGNGFLIPAAKTVTSGQEVDEEMEILDSDSSGNEDGEGSESTSEGGKKDAGNIREWLRSNVYIVMAAVLILLALIILIVVILVNRRNRKEGKELEAFHDLGERSGGGTPEFGGYNNETLLEPLAPPAQYGGAARQNYHIPILQMVVSFDNQTDLVEKRLSGNDVITLGRGDQCDVDVTLGSVSDRRLVISRQHAAVLYRPDGLFVENRSKKNRTFVNGKPAEGQTVLKNGDIIMLGNATVQVQVI